MSVLRAEVEDNYNFMRGCERTAGRPVAAPRAARAPQAARCPAGSPPATGARRRAPAAHAASAACARAGMASRWPRGGSEGAACGVRMGEGEVVGMKVGCRDKRQRARVAGGFCSAQRPNRNNLCQRSKYTTIPMQK